MPRGVYERTPDMLASIRAKAVARATDTGWCRVPGCERASDPRRANICEMHYYRLRRSGTTDLVPFKRRHPPTYRTAHQWVGQDRGKAAAHACLDCGEQAAHWSFAHRRVDGEDWLWCEENGRRPYTGNSEDYDPRCRCCAFRYDRPY